MPQFKRTFCFAILCAAPVLLTGGLCCGSPQVQIAHSCVRLIAAAVRWKMGHQTTNLTTSEAARNHVQKSPFPNKSLAKILQNPVAVPKVTVTAPTLVPL